MSDGLKLIATIIDNGSVRALREIPSELFVEDEIPVYQFIRSHYRRYGVLPAYSTVEEECDISIPEPEEGIDYYLKKVNDRRMYSLLRTQYSELQSCMRAYDMDAAAEVIAGMRSTTQSLRMDVDVMGLVEAASAVMDEYAVAHENPGLAGVPTLWPRYDELVGGYQGGDLVTYVARPGVGKTYTLLRHAQAAYATGHSILVVSMEMTITQMSRRFMSLVTGIGADYIRRGRLSTYARRRLQQYVDDLESTDRAHFFTGGVRKTPSDVDILIQELRPDICYIDSIYLMNSDNKKAVTRPDKVSAIFDETKQIAVARKLPIVATSQYNRLSGKKGKDGSLETIAYSDAISTHSSVILSLQEGLPGREAVTRQGTLIKGREGEAGTVFYHYSFRPVNMDEMTPEEIGNETQDGEPDLDWVG
jgi:replicative DNA helicase